MSKVLVVVDAQRDFITGSLKNEMADKTVANILNKVKEAIDNGDKVVFTFDTHPEEYLDTLEGKHLPVKHCIAGTEGWKLDKRLGDYLIAKMDTHKKQFSSVMKQTFGSMYVIDAITEGSDKDDFSDIESVEFIGFCTGICVVSNALLAKATLTKTEVYVDASCCACITPESHDAALKVMEACQVNVCNSGQEPWRKDVEK